MKVLDKLAVSLGRRDEEPNIRLAAQVAKSKDKEAVAELIELLQHKNKNISSDAIKVLDEISLRDAALVKSHIRVFIGLLKSKNNRLQWGAMAVLDEMCRTYPDLVHQYIPAMASAADLGSVITKDRFVKLLVKLAASPRYVQDALPLLFEQLLKAPDNQVAMYAELTSPVVKSTDASRFVKILKERLADLPKDTQRRRLEKVIKKTSQD